VLFSWSPGPYLSGGTYVGTAGHTSRVTRDEALSVSGVKRGRDLLCSIASLPLELVGPDRSRVRSPLLEQIDAHTANIVTMAMTIEDLIFDSVSWWLITGYGWDGFPVEARHVDLTAVSMSPPPGYPLHTLPSGMFPDGVVWVLGKPVNGSDMIRFDSPNGPLLVHGARTIRRALKLAQAAEMYSDDPEARAYWTPNEGADPADDDDVTKMLDAYVASRQERGEAYIPAAVTRNPIDVASPADLQLIEQQKRSDLEIANLMQLDPEDLGVSTTTRTYANATDRRQDRLNNTFAGYMRAVTDRLSLGDVTKPGYRVRFNLNDYLKADPSTRWSTYGIALDKGVKSVEEIRQDEDLPAIPVEARPAPAPVPAPQGGTVQQSSTRQVVRLSAVPGDVVTVTFASADFAASSQRRTIGGTILPFNVQTGDHRNLKFAAGSVEWNRSAVSHIKLDREHDKAQLLGAATELRSDDAGITGMFKIARTAGGDEALTLAEDGALDGLSAVVEILDALPDPASEGGLLVTSARLRRVTLTADPAFTDARVTTVAASAVTTERTTVMPCTICGQVHAADAPCPIPATVTGLTAALTSATEAFTAAVQALGAVPAEQRTIINPTRLGEGVRVEPLTYSLTGVGHSFVRDAWDARHASYGSQVAEDAMARLRKYGEQTADFAARSAARTVALADAGNTTDQAQIIPPGYRPDLYVGQVPQGRPLYDSMGTRITLVNATSFKVPVWVSSAGLSGPNVEGTGPSTGTITDHTYRTVSPTAQSGEFVVTRELMDSSNPAIDVIALNAMREEYGQDTEAVIATAVAAATDNNTGSGQSTEGCYVYDVTGTGNDLAIDGVREISADFGAHRFMEPDTLLASPTGFKALTKAVDDIGRPIFPYMGGGNAMGSYGRANRRMDVDGFATPNVWSMTSTYDDLLMFLSTDLLVGESPLLTFRFEEKGGPENIYLNIWGYFCFQILRYTGIHSVNYTAA
jgi:HK97 family phage prohead protease